MHYIKAIKAKIKTNMPNLKVLITLIFVIILTVVNIPFLSYGQYDQNFLLPFSYKEVWDTNVINKRDDYGIHQDKIGVGIDLYNSKSLEILAPVSGVVSKGCVSKGVTSIIITRDSGQVIRLVHLLDNTIKISSGYIRQGQVIGMTAPRGDYNGENCNVSSDDYHVHLSIGTREPNSCNFVIDGYNFNCAGMRPCSKSLDGSYNLTFSVNCNRKYLNQQFVSTNGFTLNTDQCNSLLKNIIDNKIDKNQENILNIQVCLTKKGLYTGVYSRVYDDRTKEAIDKLFPAQKTSPAVSPNPTAKLPTKIPIKVTPTPTPKVPIPNPKTQLEIPAPVIIPTPDLITLEKPAIIIPETPEELKEIDITKAISEYLNKSNNSLKLLYGWLSLLAIFPIF